MFRFIKYSFNQPFEIPFFYRDLYSKHYTGITRSMNAKQHRLKNQSKRKRNGMHAANKEIKNSHKIQERVLITKGTVRLRWNMQWYIRLCGTTSMWHDSSSSFFVKSEHKCSKDHATSLPVTNNPKDMIRTWQAASLTPGQTDRIPPSALVFMNIGA